MFTGLIEHVGRIRSVNPAGDGARLVVEAGPLAADIRSGDSVALSGICLTATGIDGIMVAFDAVGETLGRTTLGSFRPGDPVNMELAMQAGGRFGGHIVQGHVDGTARIESVAQRPGGTGATWRFSTGASLLNGMVAKGSVALDGVSLTIVEVTPEGFSVAIIPETLGKTTFGNKRAGDLVNVELDILGKYVFAAVQRLSGEPGSGSGEDSPAGPDADRKFLESLGWEFAE